MRWKEELYYSRTGYYEITTSLSISNPWITKIIRRQRIGYYRLRMKLQYRTKCSPYFEYIWRGVSYNHPATTVKISRSCLYFLISYGYHTHTHTHTHTPHTYTHTHTHTVSGRIMAYTKMDIVKRNRKTAAYLRLELTRQPSKPYEWVAITQSVE